MESGRLIQKEGATPAPQQVHFPLNTAAGCDPCSCQSAGKAGIINPLCSHHVPREGGAIMRSMIFMLRPIWQVALCAACRLLLKGTIRMADCYQLHGLLTRPRLVPTHRWKYHCDLVCFIALQGTTLYLGLVRSLPNLRRVSYAEFLQRLSLRKDHGGPPLRLITPACIRIAVRIQLSLPLWL